MCVAFPTRFSSLVTSLIIYKIFRGRGGGDWTSGRRFLTVDRPLLFTYLPNNLKSIDTADSHKHCNIHSSILVLHWNKDKLKLVWLECWYNFKLLKKLSSNKGIFRYPSLLHRTYQNQRRISSKSTYHNFFVQFSKNPLDLSITHISLWQPGFWVFRWRNWESNLMSCL